MTGDLSWRLLPADLVELQIGQIDLLMAMYPGDVFIEQSHRKLLDILRNNDCGHQNEVFKTAPIIPLVLSLPISTPGSEPLREESLQLELTASFLYEGPQEPQDPPDVKVRIQQPPWMSRATTAQLMSQIPEGEDLLGTIDHIREAALQELEQSLQQSTAQASQIAASSDTNLVRVWFYFPSISTRSKRDDFINFAPSYELTGFLYAGKPGLLCVEGESQSIDDYMKFIKTESWGDIPAHHKKVTERYRAPCDKRVFVDMTEITDSVGERRGQRANRGDMKAVEEWLVERGLGDAFTKVLM